MHRLPWCDAWWEPVKGRLPGRVVRKSCPGRAFLKKKHKGRHSLDNRLAVISLSPGIPWRDWPGEFQFIDATQDQEQQVYGKRLLGSNT